MIQITLSHLTGPELDGLFAVFCALDGAMDMLEQRGVIAQDDDYDLADIQDAIDNERARRVHEDTEFLLQRGVTDGLFERVILPTGQIAYAPASAGRIDQ